MLDKYGQELVNQLFDTLAGNVGMSPCHTAFPTDDIKMAEVEASNGKIVFQIGATGRTFELQLTEIESDYFEEE
jgi:hypothetical protein